MTASTGLAASALGGITINAFAGFSFYPVQISNPSLLLVYPALLVWFVLVQFSHQGWLAASRHTASS